MPISKSESDLIGKGVVIPESNERVSAPSVVPPRFSSISAPQEFSAVAEELNSVSSPVTTKSLSWQE